MSTYFESGAYMDDEADTIIAELEYSGDSADYQIARVYLARTYGIHI
jgi:hypothetical protein